MRTCPGVGGELHNLVRHGDVPDQRVVEALVSCAVEADVVCGPADPELLAAGGELADQVGDLLPGPGGASQPSPDSGFGVERVAGPDTPRLEDDDRRLSLRAPNKA